MLKGALPKITGDAGKGGFMQGVSKSIRRVAAACVISTALLGYSSIAAAADTKAPNESLLTTFIVWLQSRLTVPGG